MPCSRRRFFVIATTLACAPVFSEETHADAAMVSESDPTALSLGYKPNAAQVDKAKFPKFQTGQSCANCQLFQGKPGDPNGACPIFGGKLVSSSGWCNAYVKKA
jgi:hypothetical protein